jgi:hypothetical protein
MGGNERQNIEGNAYEIRVESEVKSVVTGQGEGLTLEVRMDVRNREVRRAFKENDMFKIAKRFANE